jgi:flagellar biosynthesis/type III secretory pathway protein FliH
VVDHAQGGAFIPLSGSATAESSEPVRGFRPEAGFADAAGLLSSLSRDERAQVVTLVENDLRREYEQRCQEESAAREAALAERQAAETAQRARWQEEFAGGVRREVEAALASLAQHTAAIARLMAEKLVRREVAADPEVLLRALETVLFKVEAGCSLQVTVHPDDAAWLRQQTEACARLRIAEIKDDRRLDPGGALVKADGHEWDATIERQLDVLAETLAEALALPAPEPGEGGDDA